MLFFGTYAQTVDAKGRVIVPTAFRDSLGKDFMIGLNGTANAIAFYPKEKWKRYSKIYARCRPRTRWLWTMFAL